MLVFLIRIAFMLISIYKCRKKHLKAFEKDFNLIIYNE